MMIGNLADRVNNAHGTVKKLNQETATQTVVDATNNTKEVSVETSTETKKGDISEYVNEITKKQEKKRINVALSQETFEKIITVAKGKSASAVMEKLLDFAVQDIEIDDAIVQKYYNTMKNKCKKQ